MEQDHRIEPLAREVAKAVHPWRWGLLLPTVQDDFRRLAAFILDRESKRVGPLVEALDKAIQCAKWQYEMRTKEAPDSPPHSLFWELDTVLATYRAIDAQPAPEPTLADVVERVLKCDEGNRGPTWPVLMDSSVLDDLRAALAREREKAQP